MARSWLAVSMLAILGAGVLRASAQSDDARRQIVMAAEENRAATLEQQRALAEAAGAASAALRAAAARALGRLERRDVIAVLLPLLTDRDLDVRSEAANAVAQAFRGPALPQPPAAEHVDMVLQAFLPAPRTDALYRAAGRLPYETVDQFRAAENMLAVALRSTQPPAAAARGLESLARRRPRLAPLAEETVERLRQIAGRLGERTHAPDVRRNAMLALLASQGADASTVEAALRDDEFEVRRLAALAMAGAGSTFAAEQRRGFLMELLQDRSAAVRLEAVRAWARVAASDHGCQPLLDALGDTDLHVVLSALDALGDLCRDDDAITTRLASEARTPPAVGPWQREAHAFVALAKRSSERAAIAMASFARHDDGRVRLYAARGAVAMDDVATLRQLAADVDDNVVEATLAPLRKRLGAESDGIFVAALDRRTRSIGQHAPARPYQVYREAARQLQGAEPSSGLLAALVGALQRASADRCDTSRDARLDLIARIAALGSAAQEPVLLPLLRDTDPRVAAAAAGAIESWTGRAALVDPEVRQPRIPPPGVLQDSRLAIVEMESGRVFRMAFYSEQAPMSKARFMRLVEDRYYDGLTFHRVVPNFVIQGGSPNANEYCGDCPFMRDEVGLAMHVRGTVGVSTRGRDTGDAQIFVNLVDTPRLDHEYTVFAYVCRGDMTVVDRIHEGDRMRRVTLGRPAISCPPPS